MLRFYRLKLCKDSTGLLEPIVVDGGVTIYVPNIDKLFTGVTNVIPLAGTITTIDTLKAKWL